MTTRWMVPLLFATALAGCAEKKKAPAPTAVPAATTPGAQAPAASRDRRLPVRPRPPTAPAADALAARPERPWAGRDVDPATRAERQAERAARRAEQLEMFDADSDGALSETERAALRETRVVEMIGRLDTDQDGRLTVDEFAELASRRRRLPDFATVDVDGDGAISADELIAAQPPPPPDGARPRRRGPDAPGEPAAPAAP